MQSDHLETVTPYSLYVAANKLHCRDRVDNKHSLTVWAPLWQFSCSSII